MANHHAGLGRLGGVTGEGGFHPGQFVRRDLAGGTIPGHEENTVLLEGVEEGKVRPVNKMNAGIVGSGIPVSRGKVAFLLKDKLVILAPGTGGVMVAQGEAKGDALLPQRGRHMVIKGLPHGLDLAHREGSLLASHHVATAHHQIRLPKGHQGHRPIHLRVIVGGPIGAVEVADDHEAHVLAGWVIQPPWPRTSNNSLGLR